MSDFTMPHAINHIAQPGKRPTAGFRFNERCAGCGCAVAVIASFALMIGYARLCQRL